MGGLALNLTPCVYPLIPITISYFGGQAQGKKGSIAAHSFLYVIGLAVTYSVLGVVAAFTGSLFGSALQYPPVLIAIAAVMVVLALSMFNVYELRVPAFLSKFAGASKKGFFGTFFMGLTVGIIAAPCIGPFVLGLLTYVGNKGNVLLGFSLFFVLALGLGVPSCFSEFFQEISAAFRAPAPGWSGSGRSSASSSSPWPSISLNPSSPTGFIILLPWP
jgi:thiol:disulfide interchange protein DsbD